MQRSSIMSIMRPDTSPESVSSLSNMTPPSCLEDAPCKHFNRNQLQLELPFICFQFVVTAGSYIIDLLGSIDTNAQPITVPFTLHYTHSVFIHIFLSSPSPSNNLPPNIKIDVYSFLMEYILWVSKSIFTLLYEFTTADFLSCYGFCPVTCLCIVYCSSTKAWEWDIFMQM